MKFFILLFFLLNTVILKSQNAQVSESVQVDTTLHFNQVNLQFKSVKTLVNERYPFTEAQYYSLIKDGQDAFEKTSIAEEFFIYHSTAPTRIQGKAFQVQLTSGEWFTIDTNPALPISTYHFERHLTSIGYYVIKVEELNATTYLLINEQTGQNFPLIGQPYVSPGGQWIIALDNTKRSNIENNGLQLIAHHDGQLKEVARYDPVDWSFVNASWKNRKEVLLEIKSLEKVTRSKQTLTFFTTLSIYID